MGNPNPKCKFTTDYPKKVAKKAVAVKLPIEVDEFVRSLPNRTDWLRQAIVAQFEKEMEQQRNS
jgi:hypothetical protein